MLKRISADGRAAEQGPSATAPHAYEFGPYRLELPTHRLLRNREPISLTPKAFDTLLALIERRDRVVDKAELIRVVWPDSFVEEANLTQTIFVLRRTLGESPDGKPFIDTVPRRGYRFAADVHLEKSRVLDGSAETAAVRDQEKLRWRWRIGMAAGLLLVIASYLSWSATRNATPTSLQRVVLAVLPLENLSADPTYDYFADGLTEEMITQLSRLHPERLAVIARTSAMKYKGIQKGAAEIGRELGADYILEGSVRREGNRVRINSRLVRVSDQTYLWAENYERELHEVLALEGEVSRAIAGKIGIELSESNQADLAASASISPQAYEDYLKGRFFWNKMSVEGFQAAIEHFEAAVRQSPEYAAAYAGLADSYANLGLLGLRGQDALPKAKAAAEKAVSIRESLAEGHASRAFIAMSYDMDWSTAEREFQRALQLNPSYAFAHHRYGYLLMLRGRWEEAGTALKRAQQLDPLSMIINANIGFRLYLMRQYDAALEHWNENLEMDPSFMLLYAYKGMAYVMKGMHREALANFEKALALSSDTAGTIGGIGYTYGVMGRVQDAQKELARLLDIAKQRFVPAFYVALLYTGLGDKDQAFAWLEKACQERSGYLMEIHVDPMFDPLRADPRFAALLRRMGLPGSSG